MGQAKATGNQLEKLFDVGDFKPDETAVVLADENLLFPVLSSLPEKIEHINVTMGYPLQSSPLFGLIEHLINLNKHRKKQVFYHHDVVNILNHPYIRSIDQEKINNWLHEYRSNNWIYITPQHLETLDSPKLLSLFVAIDKVSDSFDYFFDLLIMIKNNFDEKSDGGVNIEAEFIYHFYTHLKRIQDILSKQNVFLSLSAF